MKSKIKVLFRIPFTYLFLVRVKPDWEWGNKYYFNLATKIFTGKGYKYRTLW